MFFSLGNHVLLKGDNYYLSDGCITYA